MTKPTRSLVSTAAFLFILGLSFHLATSEASAQIRPSYSKNVDEQGRLPYQFTISPGCPGGSVGCGKRFPIVPAGKRLVLEHISVSVQTVAAEGVPQLEVEVLVLNAGGSIPSSGLVKLDVQPVFTPAGRVSSTWVMNKDVRLYVDQGLVPEVQISSTTTLTGSGSITLVGYLIDAVN